MRFILFLLTALFSIPNIQGQNFSYTDFKEVYFKQLMDSMSDASSQAAKNELDIYMRWEADNQQKLEYYAKQYINAHNKSEITLINETFEKCKQYSLALGDTKKYMWLMSAHIDYQTRHNNLKISLGYLDEYQKMAFNIEDKNAVLRSYAKIGTFYYTLTDYTTSMFHYKKAVEYGEKNGLMVPYDIYHNMASCARFLDDPDLSIEIQYKAIEALKKAKRDNGHIISMKSNILRCYIMKKDSVESAFIDSLFNDIILTRSKYGKLQPYNKNRYDNAMLYYYMDFKNDPVKAANYFNHGNFLTSKLNKARIYYALKDYKQAADNYKLAYEMIRNNQTVEINNALDKFVIQNGYDKMKTEMTELKLLNAKRTLIETEEKVKLSKELALWQWAFFITITLIICLYFAQRLKRHRLEEKKLKMESEKAVKAEQMKSLFLQNMSHEIRTPLNAIVGFTDLLNSEVGASLPQADKDMMIGMLKTNVELLQTLVSDVLDMSKFESGTYTVRYMDINVEQICKTVIESVRSKAQPNVVVELDSTEKELIINTDAQRLQQVLSNFLTNACKYTNDGSIKLEYHTAKDKIVFSVADTGVGIKPEEAEDVFTRFKMLDKAKKGTGLGLHICKLIAKLLNGKVYVDTEYTKGARFVFELPLHEQP